MSCPKCLHDLQKINFTVHWCPGCGTLVSGSRAGLRVLEPHLRELLAVRINRGEMSFMLERQVRHALYGGPCPAPAPASLPAPETEFEGSCHD